MSHPGLTHHGSDHSAAAGMLSQAERPLPGRPSLYLAPGNICGRCGGSGRLRCSHCGGSGQSTFTQLCVACNGQSAVTCSSCWGTGRR